MRFALIFGLAGVLAGNVEGVFQWIVLLGAAAGALGVLHVKVFKPTVLFTGKLVRGVDILLELPETTETIETRLVNVEQRLDVLSADTA